MSEIDDDTTEPWPVLGAPTPPTLLNFQQHTLVVPDWQSLVDTLNTMIQRIEMLERQVRDLSKVNG